MDFCLFAWLLNLRKKCTYHVYTRFFFFNIHSDPWDGLFNHFPKPWQAATRWHEVLQKSLVAFFTSDSSGLCSYTIYLNCFGRRKIRSLCRLPPATANKQKSPNKKDPFEFLPWSLVLSSVWRSGMPIVSLSACICLDVDCFFHIVKPCYEFRSTCYFVFLNLILCFLWLFCSAYSIFNDNFRELPGTLNADRFDRDIRAGQFWAWSS